MAKLQLESPRIETGKLLHLAGLEQRYNSQTRGEISKQWDRFAPHIPTLLGQNKGAAYGIVFPGNGTDCIDYFCGVEVAKDANISADFTRVDIPSQQFAKFSHQDHVSKLHETEMAIMAHWAADHRNQVARGPDLPLMVEYYGAAFNPETGTGDMEVWIPVKS